MFAVYLNYNFSQMDPFVMQRRFNMGMALNGWTPGTFQVPGAGLSAPQMLAGSMEPLPAVPIPNHQSKRRRLTRLLDKLAVQLNHNNNNNDYATPSWLEIKNKQPDPIDEDVPLDLSLKSERSQEMYPCNLCGQTFTIPDRLNKHIASRHRNKSESVRAYECLTCCRRFARSDMLTRHARLHSGLKPYECGICGQVFSRSDHLATHQRTHTGEKPYRCPTCPYAACRRDMITRHMRTHLRSAQPA